METRASFKSGDLNCIFQQTKGGRRWVVCKEKMKSKWSVNMSVCQEHGKSATTQWILRATQWTTVPGRMKKWEWGGYIYIKGREELGRK